MTSDLHILAETAGWHQYTYNRRNNMRHIRSKTAVYFKRRKPAHSSIRTMADESMTSNKRQRGDGEAQLIPGVDGIRTYGFPNSIITKLRYCDTLELTSTSGSIATNVFYANSVYDPDATGVGHQPLYYDQYAAIYDQYVVLGSKITATFLPYQVDQGWLVGIVGDDDTSISSTATTRMEQNNSVWTMTGTNDTGPVTLTCTYTPKRDIGIDAKNDGSAQTQMGANPSELFAFAVWAKEFKVLTGICQVAIEIEYTVKFAELQTPVQS